MEIHDDSYCCQLCKPEIKICGELTEKFYIAHDTILNEYFLGDASGHADLIYKFPFKPEVDVLNLVDEPEDEDNPIYNTAIEWADKILKHDDTFLFHPRTGHEILIEFEKKGWKQDIHGHIILYLFHEAGKLIESYEKRIA